MYCHVLDLTSHGTKYIVQNNSCCCFPRVFNSTEQLRFSWYSCLATLVFSFFFSFFLIFFFFFSFSIPRLHSHIESYLQHCIINFKLYWQIIIRPITTESCFGSMMINTIPPGSRGSLAAVAGRDLAIVPRLPGEIVYIALTDIKWMWSEQVKLKTSRYISPFITVDTQQITQSTQNYTVGSIKKRDLHV